MSERLRHDTNGDENTRGQVRERKPWSREQKRSVAFTLLGGLGVATLGYVGFYLPLNKIDQEQRFLDSITTPIEEVQPRKTTYNCDNGNNVVIDGATVTIFSKAGEVKCELPKVGIEPAK